MRWVKKIAEDALPSLVLTMVRSGILKEAHLSEPEKLMSIFGKNIKRATRMMKWSVAIERGFVESSMEHWKRKNSLVALVLYATAVEQYVNSMYQMILQSKNWKQDHITELIKKLDFGSKITWFFEAATNREFPLPLGRRLKRVSDIRNSIVHYKGEWGLLDTADDSYSKIGAAFKSLRRMSISRDFRLLNEVFYSALESLDSSYELAGRISDLIINYWRKRQKTRTKKSVDSVAIR